MSKHLTIRLGGVTVTCPALFFGQAAVVAALRLEDGQAPFTLSTYS